MANKNPTVPPFAGVSKVPDQHFRGITIPSEQFKSVQNQLVTPPLSGLIDLSTARSIAAGTALVVNVAGNSFYVDANADVGNVSIHFQDTSQQIQQQGMYIGPQFIAHIPFTRFLLENTAQAGKVLRFFYGVDVDFTPGINNNVGIVGTVSVNDIGSTPLVWFQSSAALAANVPVNALAVVTNVNGAIYYGGILYGSGAAQGPATILTKLAVAPVGTMDGNVLKMVGTGTAAQPVGEGVGPVLDVIGAHPVNIAAAMRIDAISQVLQGVSRVVIVYNLK